MAESDRWAHVTNIPKLIGNANLSCGHFISVGRPLLDAFTPEIRGTLSGVVEEYRLAPGFESACQGCDQELFSFS